MNYQLLWALGLRPIIFQSIEIATDFLIPIPGFLFLCELNLLGREGTSSCRGRLVLEAVDVHQEEFGWQRLHALVRETGDLPQAEAADRIISSIQQWSVSQGDDLTLLLCDYA